MTCEANNSLIKYYEIVGVANIKATKVIVMVVNKLCIFKTFIIISSSKCTKKVRFLSESFAT